MLDWDLVEEYTENAKGIAFDTCHKIYVLMDDKQVAQMREYEYDLIHTADEMNPSQMLDTLKVWFEKSCPLRFIEAVESVPEGKDENEGFTTLIEQGATDREPCEDCGDEWCAGDCDYDEDEDDTYLDDEDED
jgi:hypothetical protein